MKKLFILFAFLIGFTSLSSAQDIFKMYLQDAKDVVNNPKSNPTVAKIAQFKKVTLEYIYEKSFENDKKPTVKFLDDQAYYMNQFITSFIQEALLNTTLSKSEKKKLILLYVDASGSNPLFKDPDKDLVDAYVTAGNQLTPFSLDTDWPKAYAAVQSQMEKK